MLAINKKLIEPIRKLPKKEKIYLMLEKVPKTQAKRELVVYINDLSQYMETSYNIMSNINDDNIHEKIKIVEILQEKNYLKFISHSSNRSIMCSWVKI